MRPDGSAKWWWLSPLDRSCWKPSLVSCSAFPCSVLGMLLAVTPRPDRGGQVARGPRPMWRGGPDRSTPPTCTIRSPGVVVDVLHPSAGERPSENVAWTTSNREAQSPDRRVSMVKRVASQGMENVDIVDDLTVASVWMTLPTPFPQPDPLPPDPITPVEPSPLCYGWSTTVVPTAPTAPADPARVKATRSRQLGPILGARSSTSPSKQSDLCDTRPDSVSGPASTRAEDALYASMPVTTPSLVRAIGWYASASCSVSWAVHRSIAGRCRSAAGCATCRSRTWWSAPPERFA